MSAEESDGDDDDEIVLPGGTLDPRSVNVP
jgi:hypothetical protein